MSSSTHDPADVSLATLAVPNTASHSERTIAADTRLGADPAELAEPQLLAVGAKIGRYVVQERLGAGGMGIVYAAHDPELDRKIVLKLLHPGLAGSSTAMSTGRVRLLREAQAMAMILPYFAGRSSLPRSRGVDPGVGHADEPHRHHVDCRSEVAPGEETWHKIRGERVMRLSDCLSDWGGFEKFVAELNRTGELVSVEHNVSPVGRSGLKRQIDVLVTHRSPPFGAFKTLIDCKLWNSKVKRYNVDAMVTSMQDLSASRGAFFTTKGFQSGALEFAKQSNVDLFLVRELTDAEWGTGGRVVNCRLQTFDRSMNSQRFRVTCGLMVGRTVNPTFKLQIGDGIGKNPLWYRDGTPARSLEKSIEDATQEAIQRLAPQLGSSVPSDSKEHLAYSNVTVNFEPPRRWTNPEDPSEHVILHKLSLELVIRIRQSTFSVDKSKQFPIALAVEDCIAGQAFMVSKKADDEFVTYTEMSGGPKHDLTSGEFGIQVFLKGWFPFSETQMASKE